jgi:hypothetical protein
MSARVRSPGELVKLYRGLSSRVRAALRLALAAELVLIAATERDIQRRPADAIRGPKLLWRVVATQNVVGPAAYRWLGRRSVR